MRLSTVLYGLMQIAVFCGTAWLLVMSGPRDGHPVPMIGIWLFSLSVTAVATAIVYWSIQGVKRLMGKPPGPPVVPPRGAFDNLRRGAPARQIDADH